MIKYSYVLIVILLIIFSCKKKDAATQTVNSSSSATTTGGSVSIPAGLSASNGGDLCDFQSTYNYFDYNGTVTKDSVAFASFYATAPSSVAPTTIYGGSVTLNGITLPFNATSNYYYSGSGSGINITGNLTWSATGSGTVMAFSKSFIPNYPKYTGGSSLPDTCVKANGISITISGVTNNQNSVNVYLYSGSTSVFKYIFGSNGTVNFTPSELVNFPVNQPFNINVGLANVFSATINGVKHGFTNNLNYQKMCYLK
ncbi:MAG: hypothetical protein JWO32_2092 [Bacteroidetes bacterium]|nr:hypothetical protein [Bacteroidota bacterium]